MRDRIKRNQAALTRGFPHPFGCGAPIDLPKVVHYPHTILLMMELLPMKRLSACAMAIAWVLVFAFAEPRALALELVGGSINNTPPGASFNAQTFAQPLPWYNVGQLNGASAIYLGDVDGNGTYWVMAPLHVAGSLPSSVTFSGTSYGTVPGSFVQLQNFDNSGADMVLFRLAIGANPVNLVTLTLESTTPSVGTDLYYVGFGGGTQRWGYNTVAGYDYGYDGFGNMAAFYSNYHSGSSNSNEAQAILGDSGGAAFVYNASTTSWELGGMMFAVDNLSTPTITYSADIASYNSAIVIAVPEPRYGFLLAAVIAGCLVPHMRSRRL